MFRMLNSFSKLYLSEGWMHSGRRDAAQLRSGWWLNHVQPFRHIYLPRL